MYSGISTTEFQKNASYYRNLNLTYFCTRIDFSGWVFDDETICNICFVNCNLTNADFSKVSIENIPGDWCGSVLDNVKWPKFPIKLGKIYCIGNTFVFPTKFIFEDASVEGMEIENGELFKFNTPFCLIPKMIPLDEVVL